MNEIPASGEAQTPTGSTTPEPEIVPPVEGTSSTASPEPAALVAEDPNAIGDNETGTPPAEDPPAAAAPQQRKPKADRVQELLAERNFWRERAMGPAKAADPEPPKALEPPTLEQYGFDTEKWARAFTQYSSDHAAQVVEQQLAKVEERKSAQSIQEQFIAREAAYAQSIPDYHEVVTDPSLQQYVTPVISEAIVTSENGAALSYYLGTHRDELAAISRLRPAAQGVALGKLEARLAQASAPQKPATPTRKPVQQTRAPAPPSPVSGANNASRSVEDMPMDEYMAHRQRWANRS